MKLIEFIENWDENKELLVMNEDRTAELAEYNGRDSIPTYFNNCEVLDHCGTVVYIQTRHTDTTLTKQDFQEMVDYLNEYGRYKSAKECKEDVANHFSNYKYQLKTHKISEFLLALIPQLVDVDDDFTAEELEKALKDCDDDRIKKWVDGLQNLGI